MNKWTKATLSHFNEQHLMKGSNHSESGMWPNKHGQTVRFQALVEISDLNDKRILDVGCGFGDLYSFLLGKSIRLKEYIGIDLHPDVVQNALNNNNSIDIRLMDVVDNDFKNNEFDFVLSSGLFNVELDGWMERTSLIISEMFRICGNGVSMNFLRFRESDRNPVSHYAKIDEIVEIVEQMTKRYVIRGDYKDNDFTVYMYKQ